MTSLIDRARRGETGAWQEAVEAIYPTLRDLARREMRNERSDHTLQATAVANEAAIRLWDAEPPSLENMRHFRAISARVIRQVLVDHARARGRQKRGAAWKRLPTEAVAELQETDAALHPEVLDIHECLEELEAEYPRHARSLELRIFGGLELEEIAEVLEVTSKTVQRDLAFGRAKLRKLLETGYGESRP